MKPFALRLCPALLAGLILALPALRANDAPAAADADTELREFAELIHDLTRFAGALPKIALISASPEEVARPEFNRALARLRRLGTVQLYAFPDDGNPARPLNILPPDYPEELRQLNIPGEAYLIGLIGVEGNVEAVHVAGATRREFAVSAALAYVRWEFQPAVVANERVPVLVFQTIAFKAVPPAGTE